MYARAANENHNGPTPQAKEALEESPATVLSRRKSAEMVVNTYVDKLTSKEDFFDAIVKERIEFGVKA